MGACLQRGVDALRQPLRARFGGIAGVANGGPARPLPHRLQPCAPESNGMLDVRPWRATRRTLNQHDGPNRLIGWPGGDRDDVVVLLPQRVHAAGGWRTVSHLRRGQVRCPTSQRLRPEACRLGPAPLSSADTRRGRTGRSRAFWQSRRWAIWCSLRVQTAESPSCSCWAGCCLASPTR